MGFPAETEANILKENNLFGVRVSKDGNPYALNGSVSAYLIKPNGMTQEFHQNGGIVYNEANIQIPADAFTSDGDYTVSLILIDGTERTTLAVFFGSVHENIF